MIKKPTPKLSSLLSWVFFGCFSLFVIIFIFLLLFGQTTVISIINPTITPSVTTSRVPLPLVSIHQLATNFTFNQNQIDQIISPVASTVPTNSVSPSNVIPNVPTNMLNPGQTFGKPLQQNPQSFGTSVMSQDSTQLLCSMENGQVSFGQLIFAPDDKTYNFAKDFYVAGTSGVSNSNRILTLVNGNLEINKSASAVGCLGVNSIALSLDDLRLYVAYRDSNISSQNPFAFEQTTGKIQIFSRAPGPNNTNVNASEIWQHVTDLKSDISNPFGGQPFGIVPIGSNLDFNAFLETHTLGDEFGSNIQTSFAVANPNLTYAVGVSSQSTIGGNIGRCISMFEEQQSLVYQSTGILFLPTSGFLANTFTSQDRSSFAVSFALVGKTCVASLGSHNDSKSCRLANFQFVDNVWKFIDVILPPNENEFFGTSLCLSPWESGMVIGSPASSQIGDVVSPTGGHVYVFVRDTLGIWNLNQSVTDPFLVGDFPNRFTFGWFCNMSRNFQYLSVSANQNSLYSTNNRNPVRPSPGTCTFQNNLPNSPCDYTCIEIFAFDQSTNMINVSGATRTYQDLGVTSYIDPLFGSRVSIAQDNQGQIVFLTGSPINENITLFQMANS
jgi:hypothetical protein